MLHPAVIDTTLHWTIGCFYCTHCLIIHTHSSPVAARWPWADYYKAWVEIILQHHNYVKQLWNLHNSLYHLTWARSSLTVCSCLDQSWERAVFLTPQLAIWASSRWFSSCSRFTCSKKLFKRAFRPHIVWLESCSESMDIWERANVYSHTQLLSLWNFHTVKWRSWWCLWWPNLSGSTWLTGACSQELTTFSAVWNPHAAKGVYKVNVYLVILTCSNVAFPEWSTVYVSHSVCPVTQSTTPHSLAAFLHSELESTSHCVPGHRQQAPETEQTGWPAGISVRLSSGSVTAGTFLPVPPRPLPGSMWLPAGHWTQCLHHQRSGVPLYSLIQDYWSAFKQAATQAAEGMFRETQWQDLSVCVCLCEWSCNEKLHSL